MQEQNKRVHETRGTKSREQQETELLGVGGYVFPSVRRLAVATAILANDFCSQVWLTGKYRPHVTLTLLGMHLCPFCLIPSPSVYRE